MTEIEPTAKAIIKHSKDIPIIACFLGEDSTKKARNILEKNNIQMKSTLYMKIMTKIQS